LGYSFDVTSSFAVDGLGVWDSGSNGINTTVQAGLWTSTGTLLASVSISDSSTPVASASNAGQWLFADIPSLTLTPGSYVIGSIFFTLAPVVNFGSVNSFSTIPEITNVVGRRGVFGSGLQVPTVLLSNNTFGFGPTLRQATTPPAPVPEPATTAALVTLGAIGLVSRRRGA
jgi:hypothetical protein